ncbi:MAG: helix-turn-helix transcriptional regulator [Clostridia bacterium]|nr:helix-turn-helix transcriptional regulator [Clostridia bacterium]
MADEKFLRDMGARIHLRRREMGLTQERLAELMDVSIQMISNLELGKKAIRPENLAKLCTILGVSADYILRGTRSDLEFSRLTAKIASLPPEDQSCLEIIADRLIHKNKA